RARRGSRGGRAGASAAALRWPWASRRTPRCPTTPWPPERPSRRPSRPSASSRSARPWGSSGRSVQSSASFLVLMDHALSEGDGLTGAAVAVGFGVYGPGEPPAGALDVPVPAQTHLERIDLQLVLHRGTLTVVRWS